MDHRFRGVSDSGSSRCDILWRQKSVGYCVSARDQSHVKGQGVRRNAFTISQCIAACANLMTRRFELRSNMTI